jgi:hypothetical protein
MTWRAARSLDVLLGQLNLLYPNRSKESDGAIGDTSHQSRSSDHNAWVGPAADGRMLVTARDFTHDPDDGINCNLLAQWLIRSGDKRIKYIIWDHKIWEPGIGWQVYNGPNPHTRHLHLSVVSAIRSADSAVPWNLGSTSSAQNDTSEEDDMDLGDKFRAQDWEKKPNTLGWFFEHVRQQLAAIRGMVDTVEARLSNLEKKDK